eukprot:720563-Pyramimonas_sp.AAC.1
MASGGRFGASPGHTSVQANATAGHHPHRCSLPASPAPRHRAGWAACAAGADGEGVDSFW